MLIASLLVLSAVTVNALPEDQRGSRRTKQLDLQDIQAPVKEDLSVALPSLDKNSTIKNGYLPPTLPSSLHTTIVGAQSIQTFDFQPLNSLEKENELCKSPSCDSNSDISSNSEIPKPSRDLMPPFNDLEQLTAFPTGTTPREEQETKITTLTQNKFSTTTERLVTASSQQVTARIVPKNSKPVASATTVQAFSSKAEATNELRSYLPPQPEYSAAAQTNVAAAVQPSRPNTDHDHHHGHHHGKDFDICADAFHSFLCAPLKARKRITGAFPSNLRGQSSFINYQKLLPNYEREPAPSNTLQNAYLPPKHTPSPTNLIQSTRSPPLTMRPRPTVASPLPPKIIPAQSNSKDRFYLPPLTHNRLVPAPSGGQAFKFLPPKTTQLPTTAATTPHPTTTSTAFTTPSFGRLPVLPTKGSSHPPLFNFSPSNENRFYLPPSVNPQPAPSFISTSANISPITPTISYRPSVPASFPSAVPTSQFTSTTKKPQTVFSAFTTVTKPSTTVGKYQPSSSSVFVTTPSPLPSRASPSFNFVSPVSKTQKVLSSTAASYTSSKFTGQSSSEDRSYLPPDTNLAAAAQTNSAAFAPKNPFHHGRDLCTDPFHSFLCVSAKPRKRITGELPSGGTNPQESRLSPEVVYQSENKVEAASAQLGYKYPKPNRTPAPANVIPSSTTTSSPGYSYPKSDKVFPQQSQQNVRFTTAASSTTAKPELRPSEAKVVSGYQYPKPGTSFPLPGEESKSSPTTTSSPTTGYSYPKPQKPLTLPTEQKEVVEKPKERTPPAKAETASSTTQVKGYQYPKPEEGLKLPEKSTGYSYPKPTKRLELPTENRFKLPTNPNPSLDPLGALGSAEFIPVNKIDFKRSESKLMAGLRRFGERQKKRQRVSYLSRKTGE